MNKQLHPFCKLRLRSYSKFVKQSRKKILKREKIPLSRTVGTDCTKILLTCLFSRAKDCRKSGKMVSKNAKRFAPKTKLKYIKIEIMKTINQEFRKKSFSMLAILLVTSLTFASCKNTKKEAIADNPVQITDASTKIQVVLLLDTSGSMDGLIDQAKSRLWNIVNTLTTLKYEGKTPTIEIALYEYGNDGISDKNWIRKVTPLTQDLDLISEKLFALTTNGGEEYCGAVIKDATSQLEWNSNEKSIHQISKNGIGNRNLYCPGTDILFKGFFRSKPQILLYASYRTEHS